MHIYLHQNACVLFAYKLHFAHVISRIFLCEIRVMPYTHDGMRNEKNCPGISEEEGVFAMLFK